MERRVAPSVRLEESLEGLLAEGVADGEQLAELGRLAARLVIQRSIEEELSAFLERCRTPGNTEDVNPFETDGVGEGCA